MVNSMNVLGQNGMYTQGFYNPNLQGSNNSQLTEENQEFTAQRKSGPTTLGMMTVGGIGAGTVGYFTNRKPVSKNGNVSDTFAKKVFNKHAKKNLSSEGKKFFKEVQNILSKIGKVKTTSDFKKLLKENSRVFNSNINGISSENILATLNAENLKSKKNALKNALNSWMDYNVQNMKDAISACWDKKQKKFIKPENMDNKIFKCIKNTSMGNAWRKSLKYGGIGAAIAGGITVLGKMVFSKFNTKNNL